MPHSDEKTQKQYEKFKQAARELGCDESEETFDANLKRIAKSPPAKDDKLKKGKPAD